MNERAKTEKHENMPITIVWTRALALAHKRNKDNTQLNNHMQGTNRAQTDLPTECKCSFLRFSKRSEVPLKWAVQCIMAHGSFDLPTFRNIIMWSLVVVGRCYCWRCYCCYHFTFSLRFANKIHHKQTIENIFGHLFLWFSSCVGCCRCCRQSAFADLLLSTTKRKKWIWFTIASLCIASNDIEIYS